MQRSMVYQNVVKHRLRHAASKITDSKSASGDLEKQGPDEALGNIKLSLKDVSPFRPLVLVLRRWNNVLILLSSGKKLYYH